MSNIRNYRAGGSRREVEVRRKSYDITDDIVDVFNDLEDLQKLSCVAHNTFSDRQIVTFAEDILRGTNDFDTGSISWLERPIVDQNWHNFHWSLLKDL